MADINKTIEVVFGAVDQTKSGINSALDGYDTFDKKIQSVAQTGANFTESLLKAEVAIATVGVAMTAVAINQAGEFQGSISEIGSLFNGTSEQVSLLSDNILEYSRNSTSSIADINNATYIAISTGTEWTEVTIALAEAEKLAIAGATGLETATATLSRTMNAYGAEASEAERFSDALFVTVQNGDTNMDALAGAMGRVLSSAAAADIPIETLGAAIAGLTTAGINTNESMTLLNALFKELLKPSDDLKASLGGMSLESNSLHEITQQLATATGGSADKFFNLFTSTEAAKGAMVLANDKAGVFNTTLEAMATKTGTVARNYEQMAQDFDRVNQNLLNNIKATFIDAGIPLLDEYKDAVAAIADIFKSVGVSVEAPEFQPVYDAVDEFVSRFTETLEGVATALPEAMAQVDFKPLIDSFGALGEEIATVFDGLFGDDLDLTKPEDLAKALQQAVNIMGVFVNVTKGIISEFQPIFALIGQAAKELATTSSASSEATGNLLGALTLLNGFGTAIGGFLILIKESEADISQVFNVMSGAAKIALNSIQISLNLVGIALSEFLEGANLALSKVTFGETSDEFLANANKWAATSEGLKDDLIRNSREAREGWSELADGILGSGEKIESSMKGVGDESAKTAPKLEAAAKEAAKLADEALNLEILDKVSKSLAEVNKALDDNGNAINIPVSKTGELVAATKELNDVEKVLAETLKLVNPSFAEFEKVMSNLPIGVQNSVRATDDLAQKIEILEAAEKGMLLEFKDGQKVFTGYGGVLDTQKDKTKDLAEETDKAKEAMLRFAVEMENIASNERIKTIEFATEFNIAQVEADAKKYAAALESVATVAAAISESIGTLAGIFADPETGRKEQRAIEDIIERQEDRLDQELELQAELIQAQIDQMNAQTEALNNGESLITIEAGGLEPELEAFMFKILQRIQVKVAADKDLFLANAGF